ncbi:MAG: hypothetical protein LBJ83_01945 [Oscillospiraceae bacterium]|jgi:hypothetical protein|nr:hypothetical protein [Oscillospiraceae bacterium]
MLTKASEKYYPLDPGVKEFMKEKISMLAKSYTPEWLFDSNDPDIGSVIALTFIDMMNDNAHKMNMALYKYRIQLMNMLGITLKPAVPAKSVVVFSLLQSAPNGVFVDEATPLLTENTTGTPIIFKTDYGVYLTKAEIMDIYALSNNQGKISRIYQISEGTDTEAAPTTITFNMFDSSFSGIEKNMLVFGTKLVSQYGAPYQLCLEFNGTKIDGEETENLFADSKKYKIGFLNLLEKWIPFEKVETQGNKIFIRDIPPIGDSKEEIKFCIKSLDLKKCHETSLKSILISATVKDIPADIIYAESEEQNLDCFLPFTDEITEYRECFIGSTSVFSKKKAEIELKFNLKFKENQVGTLTEDNINFKYFMRQPKLPKQEIFDVKIQKVVLEYFNGVGWCKLHPNEDIIKIFCGTQNGEFNITFTMPEDAVATTVNAFSSTWIKISVTKAENSFRTPAIHTYPVIENLQLSYKYTQGLPPEFVHKYSGVEMQDISEEFKNGKEVVIFEPPYDNRDCIFMGLNEKIDSGPVSIYFDVAVDSLREIENTIAFEYSSKAASGKFKKLRVIDETENFQHSGCIIFNPPTDFTKTHLFGTDRYWIKIVNLCNEEIFGETDSIGINDIKLNAVAVSNVQTMEAEEFYVDRMDTNMEFKLSHGNILTADVFVNEATNLTLQEKEEIVAKHKKDIITEQDTWGNYVDFFVKWKEVDSFTKSSPNDRHYILDRQNGKIFFGDSKCGIIPRNQPRTAIKVFYNMCVGGKGNVTVNTINKAYKNIKFLKNLTNIVPAYAGQNLESVDNALNRGANLISNRDRLITKMDFENATKNFSDAIAKVKCVVERNLDGNRTNQIKIAILMKEFYKSNEVFVSFRDRIRSELLKKCDVTIKKEDIWLLEPSFIRLDVDVWAKTKEIEQAFKIQHVIIENLCKFLHPVTGNFNGNGWEIGVLPQKTQLYSFLKTLSLDCIVNKIILTGYLEGTDKYGIDFERMKTLPFSMVVSGKHHVYVDNA